MTDKQKLAEKEDILNDEEYSKILACKPCPFCGCNKVLVQIEGVIKPWKEGVCKTLWYYCQCYACGANHSGRSNTTIEQAIAVWNDREGAEDETD